MLIRSEKRQITNGIKLPDEENFRMLGEKEIYEYLGILEVDTIKQAEMKEKIKKENLRPMRTLLDTNL